MERCEQFAHYLLSNKSTIRKTALYFDISKSTVHNDLSKKLKNINIELYILTKKLLDINFNEKHIRGGLSTKLKYKKL